MTRHSIHFCYIVAILVTIIIVLLSIDLGSVEGLADLLLFALTLSSTLLAVIAIGVTLYSVFARQSVQQILQNLREQSMEIARNVDDLSSTTSELARNVPDHLRRMHEDLGGRMEELLSSPPEVEDRESRPATSGDLVARILRRSADLGLLCMLTMKQVAGKPDADFKDMWPEEWHDYGIGWMNLLRAIGIVDFTWEDGVHRITKLDETLARGLEDELEKRVEIHEKMGSESIGRFLELTRDRLLAGKRVRYPKVRDPE